MASKKLDIIISAHDLSPFRGSECSVGWDTVCALSTLNNIHVFFAAGPQWAPTQYIDDIKQYSCKYEIKFDLHPVKQPWSAKLAYFINRKISRKGDIVGNRILYYWGYKQWQKKLYRTVKIFCSKQNVDIVHHLNTVGFRELGYLYKLGIPMIIGPISGLSTVPWGFIFKFSKKEMVFETLRNVITILQKQFLSRSIRTVKRAKAVYCVSKADYKWVLKKNNGLIRILPENGVQQYLENRSRVNKYNKKIQVLWCGRLNSAKGLDLLLQVFNQHRDLINEYEVSIVGTGPKELEYKAYCSNNKISNIKFIGYIDHEAVINLMRNSDLLIHTSLREATSIVVLEALSCNLPVMCHNSFGMGTVINKKIGFLIPYRDRKTSMLWIDHYLHKISGSPNVLMEKKKEMALGLLNLSWSSRAKLITNDYLHIVQS